MNGAWADVLLATAAVLAVTGPMLFTNSGFEEDFTNHLWLASVAGRSLVEAGHPSYFLNTFTVESGVFYPYFAFAGGMLYTTIGGIAELIGGHFVITYVGFIVLVVVGAYGGALWLGRELGLRGWLAHAPALTLVTSAYYITNMYGRGDVPELAATSAIAPLIAGAVHLVRTPRWRVLPVLAFVVSTVIFTGSHNITLLWGATFTAVALLLMWLVLGAPWRLPYRRLATVAGLGVASVMVNAWFLVADIAYAGTTVAALPPPVPGSRSGSSRASSIRPPWCWIHCAWCPACRPRRRSTSRHPTGSWRGGSPRERCCCGAGRVPARCVGRGPAWWYSSR